MGENKVTLRQCFCGCISILLVAPGALFGISGLVVLSSFGLSAYFVWRVVERVCRGYWCWALTLLSCNPCVVVFLYRISPGALESMVIFVLLTSCLHVASTWSCTLMRVCALSFTAVLHLMSCWIWAVEWHWLADGCPVVVPSRALWDAVRVGCIVSMLGLFEAVYSFGMGVDAGCV